MLAGGQTLRDIGTKTPPTLFLPLLLSAFLSKPLQVDKGVSVRTWILELSSLSQTIKFPSVPKCGRYPFSADFFAF